MHNFASLLLFAGKWTQVGFLFHPKLLYRSQRYQIIDSTQYGDLLKGGVFYFRIIRNIRLLTKHTVHRQSSGVSMELSSWSSSKIFQNLSSIERIPQEHRLLGSHWLRLIQWINWNLHILSDLWMVLPNYWHFLKEPISKIKVDFEGFSRNFFFIWRSSLVLVFEKTSKTPIWSLKSVHSPLYEQLTSIGLLSKHNPIPHLYKYCHKENIFQ